MQLEIALEKFDIQLDERESNQFWVSLYEKSKRDLSKIPISDIFGLYSIGLFMKMEQQSLDRGK